MPRTTAIERPIEQPKQAESACWKVLVVTYHHTEYSNFLCIHIYIQRERERKRETEREREREKKNNPPTTLKWLLCGLWRPCTCELPIFRTSSNCDPTCNLLTPVGRFVVVRALGQTAGLLFIGLL